MPNLLPDDFPSWKKALFRLYSLLMLHSKMSKNSKFIFEAIGLLLRQLALISIPIYSGYFINNYKNTGYLNYFLYIVRIDILLANLSYAQYFSILQIVFIALNMLSKVIVFIQLLYKKTWLLTIPLQVSKMTSWVIYYVLQVPFTIYGFYNLGVLTGQNLAESEYDNLTKLNDKNLQTIVVLLTAVMHVNIILDILFGNKPKFIEKTHTRVHSIVQIHEQVFLLLLCAMKIIANAQYFLYILAIGSGYLALCHYYYLPFLSYIYNIINFHSWVSVISASILLIIGKVNENYHILDFNFIILFFGSYLISYEVISKRILFIKRQSYSSNAYMHELRLRYYLFSNRDSFEERKQKIFEHFKHANKYFFSFSLQYVWESFIINKYIKDRHLALLKLAKVNTSKYFLIKTLVGEVQKDEIGYKFRIESQFLMFIIFDEHANKGEKISYLELVRYYNYLNDFKDMDYNILMSLVDFTVKLTRKTSKKVLDQEMKNIGNKILKYKEIAETIKKKFGMEKDFSKIYGSMLKDILNINEGMNILKQSNISSNTEMRLNREMTLFDKSGPVMIVSGCYDNIGTIVYANTALFQLLSISETSKFIGSNFTELIPPPFDVIHDHVLLRFLFYRNSTELMREHLFLLDSQNNCVEVVMYFRIAFHKSYPFFIASFKPMLPAKNLILCSPEGLIYSVSIKVRMWFPDLNGNIYTSIPKIEKYLLANDFDHIFDYKEMGKELIMKKSLLSIDGFTLMIIYFIENTKDDPESLKSKKLRIEGYFTTIIEENATKTRKKTIDLESDEDNGITHENSQISDALKFAKFLNISIKGTFFMQFIIVLTIFLITYKLVGNLTSLSNLVIDVGFMRYFSCLILSNTQSLELINQGIQVANTASFYKESILNSSKELSELLSSYKTIHISVLGIEKSYFDSTNLDILKYYNNNFKSHHVNLYDSIETVIKYSEIVANADIDKFEEVKMERMFLLRNLPAEYLKTLNSTVMRIVNDLDQALDFMFESMNTAEVFCLFPSCMLIGISIICFLRIECINKKIWNTLMNCRPEVLINSRNRLTERLYYIHEHELFSEKTTNLVVQVPYRISSLKNFSKILFFVIFTIGYYIAIVNASHSVMETTLKSEIKNSNFGGMRRMLAPLTLFWTRDAILNEVNLSNYMLIMPTYDISSSSQEMIMRISQYKEIEKLSLDFSIHTNTNNDRVAEYQNLAFGDACRILTIEKCSSTLISKGTDSGLKQYLRELEYYYALAKDKMEHKEGILQIEKYSIVIENSFVLAMSIFPDINSEISQQLIALVYIVILVLYYVIVMRKTAKDIFSNLEKCVQVLTVFQNMEKHRRLK